MIYRTSVDCCFCKTETVKYAGIISHFCIVWNWPMSVRHCHCMWLKVGTSVFTLVSFEHIHRNRSYINSACMLSETPIGIWPDWWVIYQNILQWHYLRTHSRIWIGMSLYTNCVSNHCLCEWTCLEGLCLWNSPHYRWLEVSQTTALFMCLHVIT